MDAKTHKLLPLLQDNVYGTSSFLSVKERFKTK